MSQNIFKFNGLKINFSDIKGDIKEKDFVKNDFFLKSIFDAVDTNKDKNLSKDEIIYLKMEITLIS